jgi:hypothetical protein
MVELMISYPDEIDIVSQAHSERVTCGRRRDFQYRKAFIQYPVP